MFNRGSLDDMKADKNDSNLLTMMAVKTDSNSGDGINK